MDPDFIKRLIEQENKEKEERLNKLIWANREAKIAEMADSDGNELEFPGLDEKKVLEIRETLQHKLLSAAKEWWNEEGSALYYQAFEFQTEEHEADNQLTDELHQAIHDIDTELSRPWAIEE